jgi:uncharacterized protein
MRSVLLARAAEFPVVTVVGPRQSGKTTLCRDAFPGHRYVSLEAPDVRARVSADPREFLGSIGDGVIIDEVQRVPELASYLQSIVDERPARMGRFVLTGSYNLAVHQTVSQSLAGRTAMLELLPLSHAELAVAALAPSSPWEALVTGGYPAIYDRGIAPAVWLESYIATYLERDVRSVLAVGDLLAFQTFIALCAGRSAGLVNLSALSADAGISHNTARAWLSVLEAGFVVHRLPPRLASPTSRLVKTPKLHFHDTGVASWLLGIRNDTDLVNHPLRGPLFESWVVAEIGKAIRNRGERARLSFHRDRKGLEVDLVVERPGELLAIEVKSGATFHPEHAASLHAFEREIKRAPLALPVRKLLVYSGDEALTHAGVQVVPWQRLGELDWT